MCINQLYKNIEQQLGQIFPRDLVVIISGYYCYKGEHDPREIYDQVLSTIKVTSFDGYDSFGPKSNLYDFYILYKLNRKKYVAWWHRENWFCGSEEDHLYYIYEIIMLDDFIKCKYDKNIKIKFKKFLPRSKKLVIEGFTFV